MCYMSKVTNIKLQRFSPKTMSLVIHVTCHNYEIIDNLPKNHMFYIFLESFSKIQFNGHAENVACHMCYMAHITQFKVKYNFPKQILVTHI